MIHVKGIDWQPIANIPDDRKDGRQVILWADDNDGAMVAVWSLGDWSGVVDGTQYDPMAGYSPRFWADINHPS